MRLFAVVLVVLVAAGAVGCAGQRESYYKNLDAAGREEPKSRAAEMAAGGARDAGVCAAERES